MNLPDLIPDADAVIAMEPEELALRLLPLLHGWSERDGSIQLSRLLEGVLAPPQPSYGGRRRSEIATALREAWAWLAGAALLVPHEGYDHSCMRLSRRAHKLAREADPRRAYSARRIPKDALHPIIREDVWALYHRDKFDTAVFEAMKAVEVAVREAVREAEPSKVGLFGKKLMQEAFKEDGPLRDQSTEPSEADGLMFLFMGAMASYKNPQSHRNVALSDPDEAAEIIMLANHLLRIVDAQRKSEERP